MLGARRAGAPPRAHGAGLRARARGAHAGLVRGVDGRVAAAARRRLGRGRARRPRRARTGGRPCRGCSPRRSCASSPSGAAIPTRADRLADLVEQADRAAELQRIVPALALAIEWSLTRGGPLPLERLRRVIGEIDWDGAARLRCAAGGRLGGGRRAATCPGKDRAPAPLCRDAAARLGRRGRRLRGRRLGLRPRPDALAL